MNDIMRMMVKAQLDLLLESMINRTAVTMTGRRSGAIDTQISIVDRIEAKDGSDHNYNVTFNNKCTLFSDLGKAYVVRPSHAVISWKNIS